MASYSDTISRLASYVTTQFNTLNINPNINRGTIFYAWITSNASIITDTINQLENTASQSFLGSATGQFLINKAADYGVTATQAVPATGTYVFARATADPNNSWTQPAGTVVSTAQQPGIASQSFTTSADATIPAGSTLSNIVTITAVTPGSIGNVNANTITLVTNKNPNITSGYNPVATTGGADSEADSQLRQQTLAVIQPSNSPYVVQGTALGVTGIFDSYVYDWRDRNGNYTCYACAQDGTLSTALNNAVTAAISAIDGIGLTRHVQDFSIISQSIYANLYVKPGFTYSTVATNVINALTNYMNSLLHGQNVLPYSLQQVVDGSLGGSFPAIAGVGDFVVTTPSGVVTVDNFHIARLPTGFPPQITQIFS